MAKDTSTDSSDETLSQLMDGEWQDIDRSACVAGLCADERLRASWARLHLARDLMKGEAVLPDMALADRVRAAIADEPAYSNVVGIGSEPLPQRQADLATTTATPAAEASATVSARPVVRSGMRSAMGGFGLVASAALVTFAGLSFWQNAPDGSHGLDGPDAADGATAAASTPTSSGTAVDPVMPDVVQSFAGLSEPALAARRQRVQRIAGPGSFWVSGSADGGGARSADEDRLNGFLVQHLESAPSTSREGLLPYSRLVGYDEPSTGASR